MTGLVFAALGVAADDSASITLGSRKRESSASGSARTAVVAFRRTNIWPTAGRERRSVMLHSILIPHRDRNQHLDLCVWSILRSADGPAGRGSDLEILVIEHGSQVVPQFGDSRVRVIVDDRPMPSGTIHTRIGAEMSYENAFCKARLLNLGIAHAAGDVVTVLDADALVGLMWASCVTLLDHGNAHRLAYRVRYLERGEVPRILDAEDREKVACELFREYDRHRIAWEAYGHPSKNTYVPDAMPWGNSQFSMRHDDIGDLRFDEGYVGKGLEDIDFNCQVYAKFGAGLRGEIFTNGDFAMYHLCHGYDRDTWGSPAYQVANADRFTAKGMRGLE
jgi:hypothetical protein